MQWHPLFAHLLRPIVQDHYEVRTDVPVGDLPRQADILLIRRTSKGATPFTGIWSHLTQWNVVEFKGPTVDPRLHDPDLLIEVGLGVERRLNEDRERRHAPRQARGAVSFWFVANHVGRRFRSEVESVLHQPLEALGPGLWRGACLGRWLFLAGGDKLPVDRESVPLHLIGQEAEERGRELAQTVVAQPGFWDTYGSWLMYFHPELRGEVERMAKATKKPVKWNPDLRPLIDQIGMEKIIGYLDLKQVVEAAGVDRIVEAAGVDRIVEAAGLKRIVDSAGLARIVKTAGVDSLWEALTPEQRAQLKRRTR